MKVIKGLRMPFKVTRGSVVTVGIFDGVHKGHHRVIENTVNYAKKSGLTSIAVTFEPHPSVVLKHSGPAKSLISLKHRIRLINQLGIDEIIVVRFTRYFSKIGFLEFLEKFLADKLNMKRIVVGENFYFGKDARGSTDMLREYASKYGYKVTAIKPARSSGIIISSSAIRKFILQGDLEAARHLLGRRVSVLGTVVKGAGIASELGYPTANINPHHEVVPPGGVYAVEAILGKKRLKGVLNIGLRPTFYSPRDLEPTIEVHLFGFHGNLYGRDIEVFFIKKLRDEKKFGSIAKLARQIRTDVRRARTVLGI